MFKPKLIALSLLLLPTLSSAVHEPWTTTTYPQDIKKQWWDDAWWEQGYLQTPKNYQVSTTEISYKSAGNEISAFVLRPKKPGRYLPVLFQHGRRGLDELVMAMAKRLAARGFVVLAPDLYNSHFIEKLPIKHDYKLENDVAVGIQELLARDDIIGNKACVVSHTRGGYYTLKALTTHKAQKNVACYISTYPHWQDPNAPEPMQVYQYAPEVDDLTVPVLIAFGEHEQYQRAREILTAIDALEHKERKPQLIVYPGVGRGFDFRPKSVRTFADDLATKDFNNRSAQFIRQHLLSNDNKL